MNKVLIYILIVASISVYFIIDTFCVAEVSKPLRIAISKESRSTNYGDWVKRFDDNIEILNLYPMGMDSAMKILSSCDGLLLSGGEDVYPGNYDKEFDTIRCGSFDTYRDSLEFNAIDMALQLKMPIVGICRGQQILNISMGGSLYVDVPTDIGPDVIHRQQDWRNCYHDVFLVETSMLYDISRTQYGKVTSNHHQGIDRLGMGLEITAYSADSLPEAISWKTRSDKGFLIAVQWHPERMDTLHLLSAPIAKTFLKEVEKFNVNEL